LDTDIGGMVEEEVPWQAWADLPDGIKREIAGFLDTQDRASLTRVDKATHAAVGCAGRGVREVGTQAELDAVLASLPEGVDTVDLVGGGDFMLGQAFPQGVQVHAHVPVSVTVAGDVLDVYGQGVTVRVPEDGGVKALGSSEVTATVTGGWVSAYDSSEVTASGRGHINAYGSAKVEVSGAFRVRLR
jgi:hypothetical protein